MKLLLVHNHYGAQTPSGENAAFESERSMLESHGHEVRVYERRSDDIRRRGFVGMLQGAVAVPWNPVTVSRVSAITARFKPQIVHVHNTFPLVSPSVFSAVDRSTARVLTLHNYRLVCPAAIPFRGGRVCTECIDKRAVMPAVLHGCYRGSRLATLPLAAGVALHRWRGTWERDVEAFVALTKFQREIMVDAGLPADKVYVKPNFYPGTPSMVAWSQRAERVVFVGRIGPEKGLDMLVSAWLLWGPTAPPLVLVGDGPLRSELESRVAACRATNIRFTGQLDAIRAQRWIAEARIMVLPSVCYEGFPMVLREAFAFGTPCAVSDLGPLPDIVAQGHAGAVFRAGDPLHLLETVRELYGNTARLQKMSSRARLEFEHHYTESVNHERLMAIYEQAIALRRAERKA